MNNQVCINSFSEVFVGKFSNGKQANKSPSQFAHINIYVRKLPLFIFNNISFYSEQSYNHDPWSPYRQTVHQLSVFKDIIILKNYALNNKERVAGAGFNEELIKHIKIEKLASRSGCDMHFIQTGKDQYKGSVKPGRRCIINRNGVNTYLVSNVELNRNKWISIDEGYCVKTSKKVWGSENGPLEFIRSNL